MGFPGLPEKSKMYIFATIVHHLRTNHVNLYVSKIYPSGLIFEGGGGGYIQGVYIWDVNWVTYLGGHIFAEGLFTGS